MNEAQVRRLRVLHVIASSSMVRGGTSTAIWNILEALRAQDVLVDLVTTDDDGPAHRADVPLDRFVQHQGHRVRYFPRQTQFYNASGPMALWLLRHVRDYDLVHVHGLFSFAPVVAARIARTKDVPYVVCPHGMLERWGVVNRRPTLKQSSLRFVEGPILKHADRVHFTSDSELAQAQELGFPMRSVVMPLGFDLNSLDLAGTPTAREPATLLFLGRIDVKKGLDLLLDAFAKVRVPHREVQLIIAGTGPVELIASLKAHARRIGVDRRVSWTGFVEGSAKRDLLATATAYVLPSHSENYGFATVEAMAAGMPVVVSSAVGVSTLVARVGAGVVTALSVEAVAKGLSEVLGDAAARLRMGQAGIEAVRRELSLEKFGIDLAALYRDIAYNTSWRSQPA